MFPFSNESGRVIAFTARTLETGEKAGPKYINSPETPLYSKGPGARFNLDKAKAAIRAMEFALLVEGQMDCISVSSRHSKRPSPPVERSLLQQPGGPAPPPHFQRCGEL